MENQEKKISRRDALKRMSKATIAVTVASMFPSLNALANNTTKYKYVDRCYADYTNYDNYSNHHDYSNYGNYRDYSNYNDYSNAIQ